MKMGKMNKIGFELMALFLLTLVITTCERRPLEYDELPAAAKFEVKIDWSKSGINPYAGDGKGVHRVSFRFFSKDKKTYLFERYLEDSKTEGEILVPLGSFSVIVYNESVDDQRTWWDGAITFTDINNYDNFAANAVSYDAAQRTKLFPFYKPISGEQFIEEPLQLASWSIENFVVTDNMILVMQGAKPSYTLSEEETEMIDAFKNVVMRALTRQVNITARVENMVSAQTTYMAMRGFTNKVYMASGRTVNSPRTYLFILTGRKFDTGGKNGTMNGSFWSFGRVPVSSGESYQLAADVLFGTGELHKPPAPLLFDVTGQVIPDYNKKVPIDLSIQYSLPYVEGGITVDDWVDEVYTLE